MRRNATAAAFHVALVLVLTLFSSVAGADGDSKDKAKARELFKKAETQYRLGNFKEALGGYEAALKAAHHPSIIFNIAQCHRQLKAPEKSLFYYKLFLSDWNRQHPGKAPPNKAEVDARIAELTTQVETRKKAEEEAAARKKAQEEQARREAQAAEAAARKKAEEEQEAGRKKAEEKERLADLNAKLNPEKPPGGTAEEKPAGGKPKEPAPGRVAVGYARLIGPEVNGAKVMVSSMVMGTTPLSRPLRLSVGRNQIEVLAENYYPWSRVVEIKEGETVEVEVALKRTKSSGRFLLGTSIVCLLLAGGSQGLAQIFSNEYDDEQEKYALEKAAYDLWLADQTLPEPPTPKEIGTTNKDMMITGHVLTGIFGAAALGTMIGYIVVKVKGNKQDPDPASDPKKVTIIPTLGGLGIQGIF